MLVHWFCLLRFASGIRPLFRAHPKMGAITFDYLHIFLASVYLGLYLVMSPSQLTFKPESSSYFHLVLEGGHICFRWFHTCAEDLGPVFFLVIFNYIVIHPWLADPQWLLWPESLRWQLAVLVDSVFSSYFFFCLSFPCNSLYNWDLPYHITWLKWLSIHILGANYFILSWVRFAQSDASSNVCWSSHDKGRGFCAEASNHATFAKYQSGSLIDPTRKSVFKWRWVYCHNIYIYIYIVK